jgi:hypothetical protein
MMHPRQTTPVVRRGSKSGIGKSWLARLESLEPAQNSCQRRSTTLRLRITVLTLVLVGIGAFTAFHDDARADWTRGATYNSQWQVSKFDCVQWPACFFYSGQVHTQDQMYDVAAYYGSTPMLHDVRVTFRIVDNFTGASWGMAYDPSVVGVGSMYGYMSSWPYLPPGYSLVSRSFIGPPGSIPQYCYWGRPDWLTNTGTYAQLWYNIALSDGWTNTGGSLSFQYGWW